MAMVEGRDGEWMNVVDVKVPCYLLRALIPKQVQC